MREVRDMASASASIQSARREAEAAFRDGTLYVERLIERPHHVEVQVVADTHGAAVHVFERECSVQRRHQKIIEESPSPLLAGVPHVRPATSTREPSSFSSTSRLAPRTMPRSISSR